ncbi:hypothetical protein N9Z12_05025 [Opitutaceae bacterium]|nr:hypothetical protein [Opitutaceae bacterium]
MCAGFVVGVDGGESGSIWDGAQRGKWVESSRGDEAGNPADPPTPSSPEATEALADKDAGI